MGRLDELAQRFHDALLEDSAALARLGELRGWTYDAMERLGIGEASTAEARDALGRHVPGRIRRVVFPVRDGEGRVVNLLFYAPNPETRVDPKMLALSGEPRDLFPAPEQIEGDELIVLEGEPDVVTGWSLGLPCVGLPGVQGWKASWAERFAGRHVKMLLDGDGPGRRGAEKVAREMARKAASVHVADIGHGDLTDLVLARGADAARGRIAELFEHARLVEPYRLRPVSGREFAGRVGPRDPDDDLLGPLLRRGQRVIIGGHIGQGKTTLALQMVAAAGYGETFLGWQGRKQGARCLVVDLEQGESSFALRLRETGIAQRNGSVQVVSLPNGLEVDRNPEHREAIETELAKGYDLVMFDPVGAVTQNEPREEAEARALVRILDGWRTRFGPCLLVPMHCRKPALGGRLTIHDLYGFSIVPRNAEVILGIERIRGRPGKARLHWWKDRDGDLSVPLDDSWRLTFDRERLFRIDESAGRRPVDVVREALATAPEGGMTHDEIEDATGLSRSAVNPALQSLAELGEVSSVGGTRGNPKRWFLVPQEALEVAA